jgi:hypothetical protein
MVRASPNVFSQVVLGYTNAELHKEWYKWIARSRRLALVAPRDHAKTECVTINATAWRVRWTPGIQTYVFAATGDLAKKLKTRIDAAVRIAKPSLVDNARTLNDTESVYENFATVTVAGAGKAVRSAHPDIVIGDDVLEEASCLTSYQRKKTERWWKGTVSGMSHPGTERIVGDRKIWFPPTRIYLVGTPFHAEDLLLSMKSNPLYTFRRYAAEYDPHELVDGLAVDVS